MGREWEREGVGTPVCDSHHPDGGNPGGLVFFSSSYRRREVAEGSVTPSSSNNPREPSERGFGAPVFSLTEKGSCQQEEKTLSPGYSWGTPVGTGDTRPSVHA
jgi:hypothetical protein